MKSLPSAMEALKAQLNHLNAIIDEKEESKHKFLVEEPPTEYMARVLDEEVDQLLQQQSRVVSLLGKGLELNALQLCLLALGIRPRKLPLQSGVGWRALVAVALTSDLHAIIVFYCRRGYRPRSKAW